MHKGLGHETLFYHILQRFGAWPPAKLRPHRYNGFEANAIHTSTGRTKRSFAIYELMIVIYTRTEYFISTSTLEID